ncbi:hypothetical protein LTR62_000720 [Meristemomyces frigidus]|uniref:Uncharacterized protein n=1 Tax=Meristemomyces frigidus TaxID=1508187 RepID=A0AAN7T9Z4_9PEZI|nr:hypothetical protein LTR62_000720 [Meristemomyces frigidus]
MNDHFLPSRPAVTGQAAAPEPASNAPVTAPTTAYTTTTAAPTAAQPAQPAPIRQDTLLRAPRHRLLSTPTDSVISTAFPEERELFPSLTSLQPNPRHDSPPPSANTFDKTQTIKSWMESTERAIENASATSSNEWTGDEDFLPNSGRERHRQKRLAKKRKERKERKEKVVRASVSLCADANNGLVGDESAEATSKFVESKN